MKYHFPLWSAQAFTRAAAFTASPVHRLVGVLSPCCGAPFLSCSGIAQEPQAPHPLTLDLASLSCSPSRKLRVLRPSWGLLSWINTTFYWSVYFTSCLKALLLPPFPPLEQPSITSSCAPADITLAFFVGVGRVGKCKLGVGFFFVLLLKNNLLWRGDMVSYDILIVG